MTGVPLGLPSGVFATRFHPFRDNHQFRRDPAPALGLDVAQDGFTFKSVEGIVEQRHSFSGENLCEPPCGVGIEHLVPEHGLAAKDCDIDPECVQGCCCFGGDKTAPDNENLLLLPDHLLESEHVAQAAQVKDLSQIGSRQLRPPHAAPHGKATFAKFDNLAGVQDGNSAGEIDLRDERFQPEFDLVFHIPLGRVAIELFKGFGIAFRQQSRKKTGTVVGKRGFIPDERHRPFGIIFPQGFANGCASDTCADDKIIALDHSQVC